MENKEIENPLKDTESLPPATKNRTDQIIDAVGKMSIDDLQKPDAGLKMLIAQYKEKSEENITLEEKINTLNVKNSDLSNKLGVARERLRHVSGKGIAVGFLNTIAGAILAFNTSLPDAHVQRTIFFLCIAIFVVCGFYQFRTDSNQKDIEERKG